METRQADQGIFARISSAVTRAATRPCVPSSRHAPRALACAAENGRPAVESAEAQAGALPSGTARGVRTLLRPQPPPGKRRNEGHASVPSRSGTIRPAGVEEHEQTGIGVPRELGSSRRFHGSHPGRGHRATDPRPTGGVAQPLWEQDVARSRGIAGAKETKRGERNGGKSERLDSTDETGELGPREPGGGSIAQWCRANRHLPISEQHAKLSQKVRGHYAYYGITGNARALGWFLMAVSRAWRKWLIACFPTIGIFALAGARHWGVFGSSLESVFRYQFTPHRVAGQFGDVDCLPRTDFQAN